MISTLVKNSLNKKIQTIGLCVVALFFCVTQTIFAQTTDGISLSVTPTLFNMSAVPGQTWDSTVKVINNNKTEITVYAQVVNFAPQGEAGEGKFLPVLTEATEGSTLAEWITIASDPVTITPEQSYSIPFTMNVPNDASPGGHFAAILIGTKPPESEGTFKVSTSQIVTALFFVRVAGDVQEEGVVREFKVLQSFVDAPHAEFEVRFENKGNVHLQPRGDIVITNMWGKERGIIPINQETHFGNVLPQSIRKFEFSWKGEQSFSDIGRYKAVLTLAYGQDEHKFVTRSEYFYVVPVKAGLFTLASLIGFFLLVRWSIKVYVRRMLALAGVEPQISHAKQMQKRSFVKEGDVLISKKQMIQAPVKNTVADFKESFAGTKAFVDKAQALLSFVVAYKILFIILAALAIALVAIVLFVQNATKEQRDYEVTITNNNTQTTLSSEDVHYQNESTQAPQIAVASTEIKKEPEAQLFDLILVNSSDTPGLAANLQKELEAKGYVVKDLQSDFEKSQDKTVIVYDLEMLEQAVDLSKLLNNALPSVAPVTEKKEKPTITIFIGNDYVAE